MKPEKLTLTHPAKGDKEFVFQHAINLMAMNNNGGWDWKNKSDAKYLAEDETAENANTGSKQDTGKPATPGGDK